MRTLTLTLLIAVCLLPVVAQRAKQANRQAPSEQKEAVWDDKDGWAIIGTDATYIYEYRPGKTVSIHNGLRRMWVKISFVDIEKERADALAKRRQFRLEIGGYGNYLYMRELFEVNCRLRTYRGKHTVQYDSSNNVLMSSALTGPWTLAVSESPGEMILNKACAPTQRTYQPTSSGASSEAIKASFDRYISKHFHSYESNKREEVSKLGGGWAKESFEPTGTFTVKAERTNIYLCEFELKKSQSEFHTNKADAVDDNTFVHTRIVQHRHRYAFNQNKWSVISRQHYDPLLRKWFDCNERIGEGENKGLANIEGCWEVQ